jgi:hypothetical protein
MNPNLMLREAPAFSRRDALARPASFDPTARTIEVIFATGAGVQRTDERGQYLEILSLDGADLAALRGGSVLDAHQQHNGLGAVIGNVLDAWREGDRLIARLQLSERPELEGLVRDIGSGVIASVSTWQDGESNGRRTRTATKWRAREISFVPVAADPAARTRQLPQPQDRTTINRQIRSLGRRAGVSDDIVNDLVDRGASLDETRNALFDNLLSRGATALRASSGPTLEDPQIFVRAAGEALYCRANPSHTPSGPARQFMSMPMAEIARECLRRAGVSMTGLWGEPLIMRALGSLGGLMSTSDFPQILADTVGRVLRDAYAAAPSEIRQLGRQISVPDFRARQTLMLDSTGFLLEKVNEHGEFKTGTIVETGESFKIATYGRILGLTRALLVNDDLSAFTDLTRRLGLAAAAFEATFLTDLLEVNGGAGPTMSDSKTLFHADHRNMVEGELNDDTLSAARLAMRSQTSVGGGLIALAPKWLLVPSALETPAEKLLATINPVRWQEVNPFSNSLQLVVEPRLKATNRFYVVADPSELQFAYLAGNEGPVVDSTIGFRVDGVEFRVREDWGAGFVDYRGFVACEASY